jgi:hypothetical protein
MLRKDTNGAAVLLHCRRGKQGQKSSGARLGLAASMAAIACLFCFFVLFTTHNTFRWASALPRCRTLATLAGNPSVVPEAQAPEGDAGCAATAVAPSGLPFPLRLAAGCSLHTVEMSGMHGMRRFGDGTAHTLVIYVYAHTGGYEVETGGVGCLSCLLLLDHLLWGRPSARPPSTAMSCLLLPGPGCPVALAAVTRMVPPFSHPFTTTPDAEYQHNLRFFLEFGVQPNDGCDYLVVVQQVRTRVAAVVVFLAAAESATTMAGCQRQHNRRKRHAGGGHSRLCRRRAPAAAAGPQLTALHAPACCRAGRGHPGFCAAADARQRAGGAAPQRVLRLGHLWLGH